jgi:GntR family transcriptional repressor for pyruvate dehydrogenase complex
MKTFKRIERQQLSQLVADQLEEAIISGDFAIGDRLPSEQSLANQFNVSRNAVREALKVLQARGLIEIVNGSGAYVARPNAEITSDALGRYLRLIGAGSSAWALYEVRGILEGANARLAAQRADPQDLQALANCLSGMEEHVDSIEQWSEADLCFHLAVAGATHNPFLSALLEPLVGQLHGVIAEGYLVPGAVQTGLEAHARLYRCIQGRDPEGAHHAMMDHLSDSAARVATVLARSGTHSG